MENHIAGNFFLVGLMGAGKTTLGRRLAQHLNRVFWDSDQVICARTGVDIPTIFALEGEAGFRQRERVIIHELTLQNNIILATGGGVILNKDNQRCLKRRGTVIYLHVQPEILFERVKQDKNRPLLQTANPLVRFQELYAERHALYQETAHIVVDVGLSGSLATFQQILAILASQ